MASSRFVAFLRGMNLGGRRITNDELVGHVEALGFTDVWAFLASGNVALASDEADPVAVRARLEEGLAAALDYEVPTFVRSDAEIRALAAPSPLAGAVVGGRKGKPQVVFLRARPDDDARAAALALATDVDRLTFGAGAELHWLPIDGVSGSALDWRRLEGLLGGTTVRTHHTVARLAKKL